MQRIDHRPIVWSAAACAAVIYLYPLALATPLLDPDEGLHASISQSMVERGDYVVPRFLGEPFRDKPILYFAAQALSLRTFGMNEAAVRLPGLLFALLGAATTALLAARLYGRDTGIVALLVALTMAVPLALAQAAAHDVALVPWTNLAWLCLWDADHATSRRRRWLVTAGAGACVALALLAKGLIGVAVVFSGYALYLVLARQLTWACIVRGATALIAGALVASPWFLTMESQSPGYLYYYFIQRHVMGFATTTQEHGHERWHYYLLPLAGGSLPWAIYLAPGLWQAWLDAPRGRQRFAGPTSFLCCGVVGGLAFLSVASSKLITYALPLYPAIAILVAHAVAQYLGRELRPACETAFSWSFRVCCVIGLVFPFALLAGIDRYTHATSPWAAYAMGAVAAATTLAALALLARQRREAAVAVGTLWFAALFVAVMSWPMQALAAELSQKALAERLTVRHDLPPQVVFVGQHVGSVIFYMTPEQRRALRPKQVIETGGEAVDQWTAIPPGVVLAMTDRGVAEADNAALKRVVASGEIAGPFHWAEGAAATAQVPNKLPR